MLTKQQILEALRVWINQRPGLEFGNYGDWSAYRSELRSITKDRREALELLGAVAMRESIKAEHLIEAFKSAYSGRLELTSRYSVNGKGAFKTLEEAQAKAASYLPAIVEIRELAALDYMTGQYWPTEYRRAAAAVLARALWEDQRYNRMPSPDASHSGDYETFGGQRAGDWLRKSFRREFGRSIQKRWLD